MKYYVVFTYASGPNVTTASSIVNTDVPMATPRSIEIVREKLAAFAGQSQQNVVLLNWIKLDDE